MTKWAQLLNGMTSHVLTYAGFDDRKAETVPLPLFTKGACFHLRGGVLEQKAVRNVLAPSGGKFETNPQNRRLGYARVSTYGQTLDAQLEQLRADGCAKVYREKASGAQADRRELLRMLKDITPGDVVTVTRIDRLARSTFDLFATVKRIVDAGGQFRSLAEPWADTATSTGRLMIAILGGLAALSLFSLPKPAHAGDPQSHCAKVGNDDTVRTIPPNLIAGAATLFHEPANEAASHRDMYVYRCMGGSVWVCNHGANIPCAKGDTRRVLPSVTDYCNENPNQDFVPMVVTGHGTIHSWECLGGRARIKQSEEVDRRGFIANQWQLLQ